MTKRFQAVIVGGGPVGMALAIQLGMRGHSCAVIESRTGMHNIPKGQNLTHRTLEHFYFMGIVDELRAARFLPPGFMIGEITAYGNLMSEYWHAPAGREIVREYWFEANASCRLMTLNGHRGMSLHARILGLTQCRCVWCMSGV